MTLAGPKHELTHLDLFSGIGGFALAAQRAGFRTVGFSEVEPYACRVLAERFPGVPNLGDVRKRESFAGLGSVTVLTGGFPCQPWSVAGKQRGAADDRHLWPAMFDVIKVVRPAWVVGENVPGLIALGLDGVLSDLENAGYAVQTFSIPACAVDAPHKRERLWILAHSECERGCGRDTEGEHAEDAGQSPGAPWDNAGGMGAWDTDAGVCRVAHGIPDRAHRLKGLGNAIVPQVVERFFRWIRQIETAIAE